MENQEISKLLEKGEYYHSVLQTYIHHFRSLKAITFDYTDEIKNKMIDLDAKIRILKHYLIDLNNKMLDIKYNGGDMSDKQKKAIDEFLFKCCSN